MIKYKYFSSIEDIDTDRYKLIIFMNERFSYQGYDYGPPDPPGGTTETKDLIRLIGFETNTDLLAWLKTNSKEKLRVFQLRELQIVTTVELK